MSVANTPATVYQHVLPHGFLHHFYGWALYDAANERDQVRRLKNRIEIRNLVEHIEGCLPLTDEQLLAGLKCLSLSLEELKARAQLLRGSGKYPHVSRKPKTRQRPPAPPKERQLPGARMYQPPPPPPAA